jgi:hypothetical protein
MLIEFGYLAAAAAATTRSILCVPDSFLPQHWRWEPALVKASL